jgi:hypothetical protein
VARAQFKRIMHSQGNYQGLLKAGLSAEDIGAVEFEHEVDAGFAEAAVPPELSFCWRARIGSDSAETLIPPGEAL